MHFDDRRFFLVRMFDKMVEFASASANSEDEREIGDDLEPAGLEIAAFVSMFNPESLPGARGLDHLTLVEARLFLLLTPILLPSFPIGRTQ